jgi:hypothetical protein
MLVEPRSDTVLLDACQAGTAGCFSTVKAGHILENLYRKGGRTNKTLEVTNNVPIVIIYSG